MKAKPGYKPHSADHSEPQQLLLKLSCFVVKRNGIISRKRFVHYYFFASWIAVKATKLF
jgi:hypothetical protein